MRITMEKSNKGKQIILSRELCYNWISRILAKLCRLCFPPLLLSRNCPISRLFSYSELRFSYCESAVYWPFLDEKANVAPLTNQPAKDPKQEQYSFVLGFFCLVLSIYRKYVYRHPSLMAPFFLKRGEIFIDFQHQCKTECVLNK